MVIRRLRRRHRTGELLPLARARRVEVVGGKAANLRALQAHGLLVPETYVVPVSLYRAYRAAPASARERLAAALCSRLDPATTWAVRSSATVEDAQGRSYAGQFATILDVSGLEGLVAAVCQVWDSAASDRVARYRASEPASSSPEMAVLVQRIIHAKAAGVAFSRNPTSGLDEIVIEAVRGGGAALVQDGVTPERWVRKWGAWQERPISPEVPEPWLHAVAEGTRAIARACGYPVDLEWVHDGERLWWVQLRPITGEGRVSIYSNRISKEFFPGLIKPLVWSINIPLVNGAWIRLFTELIGPNDLQPEDLARLFHYRAYFAMGAVGRILELLGLPRETLELMMGIEAVGEGRPRFRPSLRTLALTPRLLRFLLGKRHLARELQAFLDEGQRICVAFEAQDLTHSSVEQLLEQADALFRFAQRAAYWNIVVPLAMHLHTATLRAQLRRIGVDLADIDLDDGEEARQTYDPTTALARLHAAYDALPEETRARIDAASYEDFQAMAGIEALQRGVAQFIETFGHLSDSGNDFSVPPWRETPQVVLAMVVHARQSAAGPRRALSLEGQPPLRRRLLQASTRRARRYLYYRDAISSLYTRVYGLFRRYAAAIGGRLAEAGTIDSDEDVYYLSLEQIREAARHPEVSRHALVAAHRRAMERARGATLPELIYGDEEPPLHAERDGTLRGVPTSRGRYTGPVCVARGISDVSRLRAGDVLVIPYSDVGWTPLFAQAGAVIAESGGILSHSSIIAREYGIPAVVSVPGALALVDGQRVTVDGYRGEIIVHGGEPSADTDGSCDRFV